MACQFSSRLPLLGQDLDRLLICNLEELSVRYLAFRSSDRCARHTVCRTISLLAEILSRCQSDPASKIMPALPAVQRHFLVADID